MHHTAVCFDRVLHDIYEAQLNVTDIKYHPNLCTEGTMWNKQKYLTPMEYLQLWKTTPNNSRH